jgi:hypothetical protein
MSTIKIKFGELRKMLSEALVSEAGYKPPGNFYDRKYRSLSVIRAELELLLKSESDADAPDGEDMGHYEQMLREVEDDIVALEPMLPPAGL